MTSQNIISKLLKNDRDFVSKNMGDFIIEFIDPPAIKHHQ